MSAVNGTVKRLVFDKGIWIHRGRRRSGVLLPSVLLRRRHVRRPPGGPGGDVRKRPGSERTARRERSRRLASFQLIQGRASGPPLSFPRTVCRHSRERRASGIGPSDPIAGPQIHMLADGQHVAASQGFSPGRSSGQLWCPEGSQLARTRMSAALAVHDQIADLRSFRQHHKAGVLIVSACVFSGDGVCSVAHTAPQRTAVQSGTRRKAPPGVPSKDSESQASLQANRAPIPMPSTHRRAARVGSALSQVPVLLSTLVRAAALAGHAAGSTAAGYAVPSTTVTSWTPPSSPSGIARWSTAAPSSVAWVTPRHRRSGFDTEMWYRVLPNRQMI